MLVDIDQTPKIMSGDLTFKAGWSVKCLDLAADKSLR